MSDTYNILAAAIANEENSTWLNNPGALTDANGNKMLFNSIDEGYNALQSKLQYDASGQSKTYSPSMSLSDFEKLYTGGDSNAANNLASMLGVPTSTTLANLSDQNIWSNNGKSISQLINQGYQSQATTGAAIADATPSMLSKLGSIPADVVAILAGLILIAGAVFGFSQVKETIITASKSAAALAA